MVGGRHFFSLVSNILILKKTETCSPHINLIFYLYFVKKGWIIIYHVIKILNNVIMRLSCSGPTTWFLHNLYKMFKFEVSPIVLQRMSLFILLCVKEVLTHFMWFVTISNGSRILWHTVWHYWWTELYKNKLCSFLWSGDDACEDRGSFLLSAGSISPPWIMQY